MNRTGALEEDVLVNVGRIRWTFSNGICRYVTYLICLLTIVVNGVSFVVLVTTCNATFWQQYSPLVLGGFTVVCSYVTFVVGEKDFAPIYHDILPKLRSYRGLDQKLFKIIKFQAKLAEVWVVAAVAAIMVTTVVCQPLYGDEYDLILPIKLYVDYMGPLATFGKLVFFEHFFYGGFLIVGTGSTLLYGAMHLKFQQYILNAELGKMETFCKLFRADELIRNDTFQKKVSKDLIGCVKHHQLITKLNKQLNQLIRYPVFGFTISGTLLFVSVTFVLFSASNLPVNPNGNIRLVTIGTFAALLSGAFIYSGQTVQDECEKTFKFVCNLPWYHYNAKNRMLLLVLMQKTQTPLDLSSAGVVTIAYPLIIKMSRSVYSLLAFLANTQ